MHWQDVKKELMDNNLLEELYESKRGRYIIALYAGVCLIAICNDQRLINSRYGGEQVFLAISEEDAFTLIKHSADGSDRQLFRNALDGVSNAVTFQQDLLEDAYEAKAEVERGEIERPVSEEGLRKLKEGYIAQKQGMFDKYGTPPRFSDKKYRTILISSILLPYGLPFWILGRPLPALLCFPCAYLLGWLMTGAMLSPLFMPVMMVVGWSCIFVIVTARFKDKKGLYVLPVKEREYITYCYNQVEKYKEELG